MLPDMSCMKRNFRDKKASVHWPAARNKERFSSRGYTANEPLINRSSIGEYVIVLLERLAGNLFSISWKV